MKRRLDNQAQYDDELQVCGSTRSWLTRLRYRTMQVRLYRWCDIKITGQQGTCRILGKYEVDEYPAKVDGRIVRVRQIRHGGNPQTVSSMVCNVTREVLNSAHRSMFPHWLSTIRTSVSPRSVTLCNMLIYNRHGIHSNIAQVIGLSHASVQKPFYVLESGMIPHYLS